VHAETAAATRKPTLRTLANAERFLAIDAVEAAVGWQSTLERRDGPCASAPCPARACSSVSPAPAATAGIVTHAAVA